MKKSIKGALLSALVFPGLGQIVLKQKTKGYSILAVLLVCIGLLVAKASEIVTASMKVITESGGAINVQKITEATNQAMMNSDLGIISIASYTILICWLYSIVDAYITGNKIDKQLATDKT